MALPIPSGGHISHGQKKFSGTAGLVHGLNIEYFAFNREEMNIDVDQSKQRIEKLIENNNKPSFAMFGGSLFLFPHPMKELKDFLQSHDIFICYDSAHVSGLIAGKQFQDPLREGAQTMTLSTHKTLPGPQGGMVLSFDKYAEDIKKSVFPGNTSNHHLHSVAGKAIVFAEMIEFGEEYSVQTIKNARALAEALSSKGIVVLGEKNGFTASHQIAVDVSKYGDGGKFEHELEEANLIANRQLLPGDIKAGRDYKRPGGIRLGSSEVTRLGMKESEMQEIANFIHRIIVNKETPESVKKDVIEFRSQFTKVHYAFETLADAYKYIKIR